MPPPGLLISAPASGTGKTTVTLGVLAALRARGITAQPFKCGPDYIDPAFHTAAAGRGSVNLDSWAMAPDRLRGLVSAAEGAEIGIAEGSMGLFDGVAAPGECGIGASADIADLMGWPVVLVLDVSGQAQSAAAVALGFARMRPGVRVAGVILNKIASPRHEALARVGMEAIGMPVFGALPRRTAMALPSRHLGLRQAEEHPDLQSFLAQAGAFVTEHLDLDAILRAAGHRGEEMAPLPVCPPAERIALARDAAFSFVYPHLLDGWRRAGATIIPFSPLADEIPDASAGVCWLPGGYPELHAPRLAAAERFKAGLRTFAETRHVHGECGGYMAMGEALVDASGVAHPMVGLLGLRTSFEKRRMHLGYRLAELLAPVPGHPLGARLRGHEFHYATILDQPDPPLADVRDATGARVAETGSWRPTPGGGGASGSFFHFMAAAT